MSRHLSYQLLHFFEKYLVISHKVGYNKAKNI